MVGFGTRPRNSCVISPSQLREVASGDAPPPRCSDPPERRISTGRRPQFDDRSVHAAHEGAGLDLDLAPDRTIAADLPSDDERTAGWMGEEREVTRLTRIGPPPFGNAGECLVPFERSVAALDAEPDVDQLTVVPRWRREPRYQTGEPNVRLSLHLAPRSRCHPQVSTIQLPLLVSPFHARD